ncbi:MAG: hypothetical protein K8W52_40030 [Deltaproteobacteria bacterium]|nr:hypothetical protein [Deltaproteobacteria bacterium]
MQPHELARALRDRWPAIAIDDAGAAGLLAEGDAALTGAHRDDLLLAWACACGATDAIAALDRDVLAPAAAGLASAGFAASAIDEAAQVARVRLVLGDDARPPALRTYRGRGPLAAFVRTTITRIAIDGVRADRDRDRTLIDALVATPHPDPELEYMRRRYADALASAMREAWGRLPAHDRFILDLQLRHRLDLDEIARIYEFHRATAARRVASARAALIATTREVLQHTLRIGGETLDSILRMIATAVSGVDLPDAATP